MDKRLLELLVCPVCKGPLRSVAGGNFPELVCRPDRLAYAVRDGMATLNPLATQLVGQLSSLEI